LDYFHGQLQASGTGWVCKLLVVGEGGVGKTCLLRALRGDGFGDTPTTHGIDVRSLFLQHPHLSDITIQLNAWDFGGQHIYHATHQFFLTDRSLFLIVWNARLGFEQGRLYYWLDIIKALAPESPVLIVATHSDERDAVLPISELARKYSSIVGHMSVSSRSGDSIGALKQRIALEATKLPDMGQSWPEPWLRATASLELADSNCISPPELWMIMKQAGVSEAERQTLAKWLHRLGQILFYQDDPELDDVIILRPDWVTQIISRALESDEVIKGLGIFTRKTMERIWADLERGTQDHLLRLMERFDLSYRTLENRDISIVVERLNQDPPDYEKVLADHKRTSPPLISMRFQFGSTLPPGLPTWFIARSHRFTTYTHWRYGALFADGPDRRHLALVQASPHDRSMTLDVSGPSPQNFFALLRDGLEVTIGRFPGLVVFRKIPCPGHSGQACVHEFDLTNLEKALERFGPEAQIQCPVEFENVSVLGLLFGINWRTQDAVLREVRELRFAGEEQSAKLRELLKLTQREFLTLNTRDRDDLEAESPRVFMIRPSQAHGILQTLSGEWGKTAWAEWWDGLLGQELELQLFCEQPGAWHPACKGGLYKFRDWAKWMKPLSRYLRTLVGILQVATPLSHVVAGSGLSSAAQTVFKDEIKFMDELVRRLPAFSQIRTETTEPDLGFGSPAARFSGVELRVIRKLLESLDSQSYWGGLKRSLTPEGHYLWLCEDHAREYEI